MAENEDQSPEGRSNGETPDVRTLPDRKLWELIADQQFEILHRLDQGDAHFRKIEAELVVTGESARRAQSAAIDATIESRESRVAAKSAVAESRAARELGERVLAKLNEKLP